MISMSDKRKSRRPKGLKLPYLTPPLLLSIDYKNIDAETVNTFRNKATINKG